MRAGRLRFRVEVQEAIETRNDVGEVVKEWTSIESLFAAIDPLRGDERMTMQQVKPTVDTKIMIRGNAAKYLTPKHRLKYGDRVFDIDSIIDMNSRGIVKEIHCKEQA
jgi:SPP1 family predicted phage head-tail adaptor